MTFVDVSQVVAPRLELIEGPPFCNDVVIDKESGLAFLACDPFKPSFYPPFELYNASRVYGDGGIWLFDTNVFVLAAVTYCRILALLPSNYPSEKTNRHHTDSTQSP
jgi:hypothetical protein